jgi:hypothetical protein
MEKILYKTANKSTTFIITAQLCEKITKEDGTEKEVNKLLYTMIQRDANNKAVTTLKYWQDLEKSYRFMRQIYDGSMFKVVRGEDGAFIRADNKRNEYKGKNTKKERTFSAECIEADGKTGKELKLRFKVMEADPAVQDSRKYLYFDLSEIEAKDMAYYVHEMIKSFINVYMMKSIMKKQ